jgi:hypothetical protein
MVSGNQPQSGYGQNYQQPSTAAMNNNVPQGGTAQQPGAMGAPGTGQHQHGVHTPPQMNPTGAPAPGQGNQTVNNQQQGGNGQGPHPPPPGGYHAVPPGNRLYQQAAPYDPNTQFPNNAQQPINMQPNIPPGYARIPPNPNLPPGFDPQAFQIGGTKTNLGTIGKLGDELLWDEWLMRVEGQLNCNWWAYLIDDPLCPPHVWHTVKMWVIQWLNKADSQQVLRCHSWAEAKDKIRRNHSPDDATTINQINEMLMAARLGASEPPSSLINRVLDLNATLESLNAGWTEAQVVTAITKALKTNTHYDQIIRTLKSIGGHLTLKAIQNAFNANVSSISVPGAFMVEEAPHYPDRYDRLAESVANLAKQFKSAKKPFQKTRFESRSPDSRPQRSHQKPGSGRHERSRSPATRGRNPTRGRSPTPTRKQGEKCFNCGMTNHKVTECRNPCGMCGKKDHKVMNCIMNPKSDNYVPPYKRRDPNAGPNRPPGKALVASSEGYHHPHTDEAQAMNAMGGELFNLGATFSEEEEGIDPEYPNA